MLVAVAGTPGVGKTSVCGVMSERGFIHREIKDIILSEGLSDGEATGGEEITVDMTVLQRGLGSMGLGVGNNVVLDGHLSYLAPSDVCIVLRLHPDELRRRLEKRGYDRSKIAENVDAEAVSVVLVEAMEMENGRLNGCPWSELPPNTGIVLEIDTTGVETERTADTITALIDAYRGKRLNELIEYRPGRVDWLEVVAGWY